MKNVDNIKDFQEAIKGNNIAVINWCGQNKCEENIKDKFEGVKSLNIDLDNKSDGNCICGEDSKFVCRFGRSY